MTRFELLLGGAVLALSLVLVPQAAAQEVAGLMLYQTRCANCHGQNGWGDEEKRVPAIAGLPSAYVMRQIDMFRSDLRKEVRMHREAVTLDEDLSAAAQAIAAMTRLRPVLAGPADAENGQKIVRELCSECHGNHGEGKPERDAPPLTGFQSWYIVDQVRHFRDFVRQEDSKSFDAQRMHVIAYKTVSMEDVEDVAAFLVREAGTDLK